MAAKTADIGRAAGDQHGALQGGEQRPGMRAHRLACGRRAAIPGQNAGDPGHVAFDETQHLGPDFGRQRVRLRRQQAAQAHPPIPLQRGAEGGQIGVHGARGIELARVHLAHVVHEAIGIAPGHGGTEHRLGREMVMHTGALDPDGRGKIAETQAVIADGLGHLLRRIENGGGGVAAMICHRMPIYR